MGYRGYEGGGIMGYTKLCENGFMECLNLESCGKDYLKYEL